MSVASCPWLYDAFGKVVIEFGLCYCQHPGVKVYAFLGSRLDVPVFCQCNRLCDCRLASRTLLALEAIKESWKHE